MWLCSSIVGGAYLSTINIVHQSFSQDIMAAVLTELEFAVGFTAREHAVDLGAKTLFSLEPLTNHADVCMLTSCLML